MLRMFFRYRQARLSPWAIQKGRFLLCQNFSPAPRRSCPTLKEIKDDLHRHPELAFEERRATDIIRRRLTGLGIELIDLGMETGAVGFLRCGRPAPPWPSGPISTLSSSRSLLITVWSPSARALCMAAAMTSIPPAFWVRPSWLRAARSWPAM